MEDNTKIIEVFSCCADRLHNFNISLQQFFEALLKDIDLCQLEAVERRLQIGWYSGAIRDECF